MLNHNDQKLKLVGGKCWKNATGLNQSTSATPNYSQQYAGGTKYNEWTDVV